jgi:hypothetical protein
MSLLSAGRSPARPKAVVMETAHCGEISGESFRVPSLQLLDEELTLAAITSLAVCALGVEGREVTLLVPCVVALLLIR